MKAIYRGTVSVWRRAEGSWLLLAFLILTLFFVPFLEPWFPRLGEITAVFLVVLLIVGVLVVFRSAWATAGACVLAGTAISLELVRQISGEDPYVLWRTASAGLTMGLFMAVALGRVFARGLLTPHRLVWSVSAYLLVGLTWAYAYEFLDLVRPGALSAGANPGGGAYPAYLYFSFTTLTTVGYGDMTPVLPQAQALANIESIVGVLYPAVLIGRLLSVPTFGGMPPADPSGPAVPPAAPGTGGSPT